MMRSAVEIVFADADGLLCRRKEASGDDDLATRVQQLENLIRQQAHLQTSPVSSLQPSSLPPSREGVAAMHAAMAPELPLASKPAPHSAVEEAAVAALGQLSKAIPKEGGYEARICECCTDTVGYVSAMLKAYFLQTMGQAALPTL